MDRKQTLDSTSDIHDTVTDFTFL